MEGGGIGGGEGLSALVAWRILFFIVFLFFLASCARVERSTLFCLRTIFGRSTDCMYCFNDATCCPGSILLPALRFLLGLTL